MSKLPGKNVQLTSAECAILQRIGSRFPPGVMNPSRIARLCIRAGASIVEADFDIAARR